MNHAELSRIVNTIALRCIDANPPGYFDCLELLDMLEFHVLDFMDQGDLSDAMQTIRDQAQVLHSQLSSIAQASIDELVQRINSHQLANPALRQLFYDYADSIPDKLSEDEPDYDFFDDFLIQLMHVDYEPSETRARGDEMFYLQPTPGRVILNMIKSLGFTKTDRFYDLGSGLGRVPILVSLLTDAYAVGVEYEPSYIEYSKGSAEKLGIKTIEFRNQDARDADISDGTLFFMYTPFTGSILRTVLDKLRDLSQQRPIKVCTYGPCTPQIERETWLYPIRHSRGDIYRLAIFSSIELAELT